MAQGWIDSIFNRKVTKDDVPIRFSDEEFEELLRLDEFKRADEPISVGFDDWNREIKVPKDDDDYVSSRDIKIFQNFEKLGLIDVQNLGEQFGVLIQINNKGLKLLKEISCDLCNGKKKIEVIKKSWDIENPITKKPMGMKGHQYGEELCPKCKGTGRQIGN